MFQALIRTWSAIIGVLGIIVSALFTALNLWRLLDPDPLTEEDLEWFDVNPSAYVKAYTASAYVETVFGALGIICYLTLIVGSIKKTSTLLKPSLVFLPVRILWSIIFTILFYAHYDYAPCYVHAPEECRWYYALATMIIVQILLPLCVFSVVRKFNNYLFLKRRSEENQNHFELNPIHY